MTPLEVLRQHEELAPKDDLRQFEGQWVALRRGHVVAHDRDPAELLGRPEVEPGDAIMQVTIERGHLIL